MPDDPREIDILNSIAIDVKFVFIRQAGDKFRDPAFGSVMLVNKRRDHCDAAAGHARRQGTTFISSDQRARTNKLQMRDQPTDSGEL